MHAVLQALVKRGKLPDTEFVVNFHDHNKAIIPPDELEAGRCAAEGFDSASLHNQSILGGTTGNENVVGSNGFLRTPLPGTTPSAPTSKYLQILLNTSIYMPNLILCAALEALTLAG